MKGITLQSVCRIRNKWIRDGLSEILCTFILAVGIIIYIVCLDMVDLPVHCFMVGFIIKPTFIYY